MSGIPVKPASTASHLVPDTLLSNPASHPFLLPELCRRCSCAAAGQADPPRPGICPGRCACLKSQRAQETNPPHNRLEIEPHPLPATIRRRARSSNCQPSIRGCGVRVPGFSLPPASPPSVFLLQNGPSLQPFIIRQSRSGAHSESAGDPP